MRGEECSGRKVHKAGLVYCAVDADERAAYDRLRFVLGYILRGQHQARNLELAGTQLNQTALSDAVAREDWQMVGKLVEEDVLRRNRLSGTPDAFAAARST